MARTKRKINPVTIETTTSPVQLKKRYRAAGYARLSVEDSGKPGAAAIESQKKLIMDFIQKAPDLEFVSLFSDNGETGTDFRRPGFESMMESVRRGEINCVVVKDLSRFGRNYKETGNYLERIFPVLGVRFVAITDCFDTLTAEQGSAGCLIPLKNLINEAYSRDISGKTSSALRTKQQIGEYIGTWAPYGYRKSGGDKHRLVPDPDTAPVVRRIFRLRLENYSYQSIAMTLNAEGLPSPAKHLAETGLCKNEVYAHSLWKSATVKNILERQVYLGHMVQGSRHQSFCDGQKRRHVPNEKRTVVMNTHEPIIDEKTFAAVQAMAGTRASTEKGTEKGGVSG